MNAPNHRRPYRRVIAAVCAACWVVSAVATHTPNDRMPVDVARPSLLHGIGYALLTAMFLATLIAYDVRARRRWWIVAVVIAAYGAADEATQPWFGREADVNDWLIDLLGAALAWTGIEIAAALARVRARAIRRTR